MLLPVTAAVIHLCAIASSLAISEDQCGIYTLDQKTNTYPGKRLVNHNFFNTTVGHPLLCFNKCSENCHCESFNVCGNRCELSTSTKESSSGDYKNEAECTYYDMGRVPPPPVPVPQYQSTCDGTTQKFCCRLHNPCLNDGVCIGFCPDLGKRFECKCRPGYYGYRCQAHLPSTCQDYWTIPKPANGMYTVFNENNATIKVYCDFNSEEGLAWTLFMSRGTNQSIVAFWMSYLGWNDNSSDIIWSKYRLSKPTAVHLSQKSTHWRATCEYEKLGVNYVDYLRSKISETNPMTYNHKDFEDESDQCRLVEYVDIRGQHCSNCKVLLKQGGASNPYSAQPWGLTAGCSAPNSFATSDCPATTLPLKKLEFYFGRYDSGCRTGKHRCNERTESTTQFWFAG